MSNVVRFFAASRADAVAALEVGPEPTFPMVTYGNFDAEEALLNWEADLTGRSFDDVLDDDVPEVVAEEEDGPEVLALSEPLRASLVAASPERLGELARSWSAKASGRA